MSTWADFFNESQLEDLYKKMVAMQWVWFLPATGYVVPGPGDMKRAINEQIQQAMESKAVDGWTSCGGFTTQWVSDPERRIIRISFEVISSDESYPHRVKP